MPKMGFIGDTTWPWPWTQMDPLPSEGTRNYRGLPRQVLPQIASPRFQSPASKPTDSPLFRLPSEIRQYIWRLSLTTDRLDDGRRHIPGIGLLQTCCAAYEETWDLPIKQTALTIHAGCPEERRQPEDGSMQRPGEALFYLQAWQLLLVGRIDVTASQELLEGSYLYDCGIAFGNARMRARSIVMDLLKLAGRSRDEAEGDLLLEWPVTDLVVQLGHRDWRNSSSPSEFIDFPRQQKVPHATTQVGTIDLDQPHPSDWPQAWAGQLAAEGVQVRLVLETVASGSAALKQVVDKVRKWRMNTSSDGAEQNELICDGVSERAVRRRDATRACGLEARELLFRSRRPGIECV